ncbi:MAG: histidine triad nucleotide-binding protein [Bdellovibrionota bacterium]|nr:MAG: histidine triad nucleotide-binding protein [Bdellovibrionota bacterium]
MSEQTIFAKIIRKEIPAAIVYENERILAFKDIAPQAPTHILVIPKKALADVAAAKEDDAALLGELLLSAAHIAKEQGLTDYRIVINNGAEAGQTVFHLHLHLLGGRPMRWPPG